MPANSLQNTKGSRFEKLSAGPDKVPINERASLKPPRNLHSTDAPQPVETWDGPSQDNEFEFLKENSSSVLQTNGETSGGYADQKKFGKRARTAEKDILLLSRDRFLKVKGHGLTYLGIFLFTFTLYFRPYELIPGLSFLSSIAWVLALATLLIYIPTQIAEEGSLTTLSTEVKCILFLFFWAILTMPLAKSPGEAWTIFNENFSKVVIIFVIMINTLRTQSRLKGLMWLAVGVGVMLSYQAIGAYRRGEFRTEGYRVSVDFGGMFGNPNDLALHLVMFMPIAIMLGIASRGKFTKLMCFASAGMMILGVLVTQSRGAFLGLLMAAAVLIWKLGKQHRFRTIFISVILSVLIMAFAPGNYGKRVLSIFVPGLDEVGSSDQRSELLKQSIWVTLRNPQGIGIGNFPIVGARNLGTHNAYTQISAELGWLALVAYLILIISPLRKLGAIERQMSALDERTWIYYMSIGLQACIASYMVSSFFGAVAYQWYIYYPIAFAVCLRRMYRADHAKAQIEQVENGRIGNGWELQKA